MDIYDRIDRLLKGQRMSRRKLAELAGINVNTMSSLFARRPNNFPRQYLESIARVLNVAPADLEGFGNLSLFVAPASLSNSQSLQREDFTRRTNVKSEPETANVPLSQTLAVLEKMDRPTLEFVAQYVNTLLSGAE